jgi:hypothetical protein
VIRFNCPTCGRPYEVPDALARLPLVCKQCGQRITPAEAPKAETPPPAPVIAKPQVASPQPPKPQAAPPLPPSPKPHVTPAALAKPAPPPPDDDDVLVTKADSTPDIDFNVGGPTAASLSDATRARPTGLSDANRPRPADLDATEPDINLDLLPPPAPKPAARPAPPPEPVAPEAPPEPTLVPFVADLVTFVLLVVIGMVLGELLVGKPTGEVLSEAGAATKFPPIDLMLWGGPPLVFGLIYLLLSTREKSVGAWLRRRAANTPETPDSK